jgi:GNAT superfamily N-acetyltransferase
MVYLTKNFTVRKRQTRLLCVVEDLKVSVNIRMANSVDSHSLWQLICDLAAFQGHPGVVKTKPETLSEQLASSRPPFECLVAESNNELVGFALFFHSYSTWEGKSGIYLEDLYVCPSTRGLGIGKLLLEKLAEIGASRGCARIDWTVLRSNLSALDFYEKIGAQNLSDWSHFRLPIAQSL